MHGSMRGDWKPGMVLWDCGPARKDAGVATQRLQPRRQSPTLQPFLEGDCFETAGTS